MRYILFITSVILLASCNNNQQSEKIQQLEAKIDSLQIKLDSTYKPGFGEFMRGVQLHHAKLWFAGINQNWPLAKFELDEIREALTDIQKYDTDRPETTVIPMINEAMDSITNVVKQQNVKQFRNAYSLLTSTCNDCHVATQHEYNVIKIPTTTPIGNQSYEPVKQ